MISRELAGEISALFEETSSKFGDFQKKSGLNCPPSCGKCCFKSDIYCAPYELLPMAIHLLDTNLAEIYLEKAKSKIGDRCIFLNVTNEEAGHARCEQYEHRPYICRAFGVGARRGKNDRIDFSICRTLKNNDQLPDFNFDDEEVPFIEIWKKRLQSLDPRLLDKEMPINESLVVILEKVLLWSSLGPDNRFTTDS